MRNLPGFPTRSARSKHVLPLLIFSALSACAVKEPPSSQPPFATESDYQRFIDAARAASYVPAEGETRKLPIPGTTQTVTASVEPIAGVRGLGHTRRRGGVVLARIVADGDYPHIGVKAGTNYLYVDSIAGAGWRSIVVPERFTARLTVLALAHGDAEGARKAETTINAGFVPDGTAFMTTWIPDDAWGCSCGRSSGALLCH